MDAVSPKKAFDKKAYRQKKYDKKSKLEDYQNRRKSLMKHKYKKIVKSETVKGLDVGKLYSEYEKDSRVDFSKDITGENSSGSNQSHVKKPYKRPSSHQRAKMRLKVKKAEQEEKEAMLSKKKTERENKRKIYLEKKIKRTKTLNAHNKKGQPLMGGRMEMLLEKIQQSM